MSESILSKIRSTVQLLVSCLVYSLIVMIATTVIVFVMTWNSSQTLVFLAYGLLIEAGGALVVGGAVANFSPAIGKIGESVVHSAPWDAKRIREAEKQARSWIVTGAFLLIFGLVMSGF